MSLASWCGEWRRPHSLRCHSGVDKFCYLLHHAHLDVEHVMLAAGVLPGFPLLLPGQRKADKIM